MIGALTYSVRVRTREIAIRIAIGADPIAVRRVVVRQALAIVGLGILCGTALGTIAGSFAAHQWFEVGPVDGMSMIAVAAGLMAFAWIAAFVPARTASRVEPAEVLRHS